MVFCSMHILWILWTVLEVCKKCADMLNHVAHLFRTLRRLNLLGNLGNFADFWEASFFLIFAVSAVLFGEVSGRMTKLMALVVSNTPMETSTKETG